MAEPTPDTGGGPTPAGYSWLAPAADSRLLLLANEADEVPLISALLQDALLRPADVAYDRRARRLVLLVNRFRWEEGGTRVRAAVRIEHVVKVERRGWTDHDAADPGIDVLNLLAWVVDDDVFTITFAAGAALRVTVECVDLILEDLGPPWPAGRVPAHD